MSIRVAIVGVGNCASALVQGVDLYTYSKETNSGGLMFPDIGGYTPESIKFVAAFDVDARKIGKRLRDAIWAKPNCCINLDSEYTLFNTHIDSKFNPVVQNAPIMDGVATHMRATDPNDPERFYLGERSDHKTLKEVRNEMVQILKERKVDVLLNYLPVGSQYATEFWADVCIRAGVNMVNCIPCFIASDKIWAQKFVDARVTIIGDDMRSQIGASIISAALQELFLQRGAEVEVHYQDNVGGNTDFLNMQDQSRLASKKISKENVIRRQNDLAGVETKENSLAAGPAKYFPTLGDNKRAHFLIKGTVFGGAPFEFTADLSCQDSPNSAGVVIDAIRLVKVANELGIVGPVVGASAATQKTPPEDMGVKKAYEECGSLAKRNIPEKYIRLEEFEDGHWRETDYYCSKWFLNR